MKTVDFFKSEKKNCNGQRKHGEIIPQELQKGINVESEHKKTTKFLKHFVKRHGRLPSDREIYKSIARDHLKEDKHYYKKLLEMESH